MRTAAPRITIGIAHSERLKRNTAMTTTQTSEDHGSCPGGAALSESKLAELLSVREWPAQIDPLDETQREFRVERPSRWPDSKMTGSDFVFLEPQTGQLQLTNMPSASQSSQP